MKNSKLVTFQEYSSALKESIQHSTLKEFIQRLNRMTAEKPGSFFTWFFLGKSFEQEKDAKEALRCYLEAEKCAAYLDQFHQAREALHRLNNAETGERPPSKPGGSESPLVQKHSTQPAKKVQQSASAKPAVKPPKIPDPVVKKDRGTLKSTATAPTIHSGDWSFRDKLRQANKYGTIGEPEKALKLYEELYFLNRNDYNLIYVYVACLRRLKQYDKALTLLDTSLRRGFSLEEKNKLLLIKAQILSGDSDYKRAETAYLELVRSLERAKSSIEVLSFSYEQLARIQGKLKKIGPAIESAKIALSKGVNAEALGRLVEQLEELKTNTNAGVSIEIQLADDQDLHDQVSPMLEPDLTEFRYTDPQILRQESKPDWAAADRLFNNALSKKSPNSTSLYPKFLEAAKAFYDLRKDKPDDPFALEKLNEALTNYAFYKGAYLFNAYKAQISSNNYDLTALERLKDSASSYLMEAVNLQSRLGYTKDVLATASTLLKLNVTWFALSKKKVLRNNLFKGSFSDVLNICLDNEDRDFEKIAYTTIISFGSYSLQLWNKLAREKGGTGSFIQYLEDKKQRQRVYDLVSLIEQESFDKAPQPAEFFRRVFANRKNKSEIFKKTISNCQKIEFKSKQIGNLKQAWKEITDQASLLLSGTDLEIVEAIDHIIKIFEPYPLRGETEKPKILYNVRIELGQILANINANTTYWGRVAFYPLLSKWAEDIGESEKRFFAQTLPRLAIQIDPYFILQEEGQYFFHILIKNEGMATAERVDFRLKVCHLDDRIVLEKTEKIAESISTGVSKTLRVALPFEPGSEVKALKLQVLSQVFYERRYLDEKSDQFTLEPPNNSSLSVDDIPWKESGIPPKMLFKGRDKLLDELREHYLSKDHKKSVILYGLTRTGKSSILQYLGEMLDGQPIQVEGQTRTVVAITWPFENAASQTTEVDMWGYLLRKQIINTSNTLYGHIFAQSSFQSLLGPKEDVRFKHFEEVLKHLSDNKFYPIFLVDEFSSYRDLVSKFRIGGALLQAFRNYTFQSLASFLFAGTYDLKELLKNPDYGFSGQMVNAEDKMVGQIEEHPARELITVIQDKLNFTEEAIKHILFLSNQIPYFIQIICSYCGYYAVDTGRGHIGVPEVDFVTDVLIGRIPAPDGKSRKLSNIDAKAFKDNQYSEKDPPEVSALLCTFTHFHPATENNPYPVSYSRLKQFWQDKKADSLLLSNAISLLRDKQILLVSEGDEADDPKYRIGVDFFRRWWAVNKHPEIELIFDTLKKDSV